MCFSVHSRKQEFRCCHSGSPPSPLLNSQVSSPAPLQRNDMPSLLFTSCCYPVFIDLPFSIFSLIPCSKTVALYCILKKLPLKIHTATLVFFEGYNPGLLSVIALKVTPSFTRFPLSRSVFTVTYRPRDRCECVI